MNSFQLQKIANIYKIIMWMQNLFLVLWVIKDDLSILKTLTAILKYLLVRVQFPPTQRFNVFLLSRNFNDFLKFANHFKCNLFSF